MRRQKTACGVLRAKQPDGIVDAGDHFIVGSGEADLACRITHIPKDAFVPSE